MQRASEVSSLLIFGRSPMAVNGKEIGGSMIGDRIVSRPISPNETGDAIASELKLFDYKLRQRKVEESKVEWVRCLDDIDSVTSDLVDTPLTSFVTQ